MKKPLTFQNLLSDIPYSESTLRRLISDSRKGIGDFPKPITGFKRKMLFNSDDIQRWMSSQQQQPSSVEKVESETQRQRRHKTALASLRAKGVKVAANQQKDKET